MYKCFIFNVFCQCRFCSIISGHIIDVCNDYHQSCSDLQKILLCAFTLQQIKFHSMRQHRNISSFQLYQGRFSVQMSFWKVTGWSDYQHLIQCLLYQNYYRKLYNWQIRRCLLNKVFRNIADWCCFVKWNILSNDTNLLLLLWC